MHRSLPSDFACQPLCADCFSSALSVCSLSVVRRLSVCRKPTLRPAFAVRQDLTRTLCCTLQAKAAQPRCAAMPSRVRYVWPRVRWCSLPPCPCSPMLGADI
eukprot:933953-Rhodomonas_salina.1